MIEVLLVDDETYVTESLAHSIPWADFGVEHVYQADNAVMALDIMEQHEVDVIITDIRMPGMDGLELLGVIASRWPNVRAIVLTGHSDFEYARKAIQLHAVNYILKPVNDEEFMNSLSSAIQSLQEEWSQAEKYDQLLYNFRTDAGFMKQNLMCELLLGHKLSAASLQEKLMKYEIPLSVDDRVTMVLAQFGKQFAELDQQSVSLLAYAAGNIAEEIFSSQYRVFHCKTPHDSLLLIVAARNGMVDRNGIDEAVRQFQRSAGSYLKRDVAVVISGTFVFPDELAAVYRNAISALYPLEISNGTMVWLDEPIGNNPPISSMESLHKPPSLLQLLEFKSWDAALAKITESIDELEKTRYTREHLYEVFLTVANACLYVVHRHGRLMHRIDHSFIDPYLSRNVMLSPGRLRTWAFELLHKVKIELTEDDQQTRSRVTKHIQEIVLGELGEDVSVKTLADRVYLHPVYLSKIYKSETGESLGDYIIRMRMERARFLLKSSNKKIYEITQELGYQNPQYFSKMFKRFYGLTPNEYREQ